MDSFEGHLLQFVETWTPFAGPTGEDTLPQFGLRASSVHCRFIAMTRSAGPRPSNLEEHDADPVRRAQVHLHEDHPLVSPTRHADERTKI
jgi:hypothetical protein